MFLHPVLLGAAAAAALTFVSTATVRAPERSQSEPPKKACCFQNSAYSGTCKVVPSGDETCASILAYLNNPMAEVKSYCEGTSVRRGWIEVDCEKQDESPLER